MYRAGCLTTPNSESSRSIVTPESKSIESCIHSHVVCTVVAGTLAARRADSHSLADCTQTPVDGWQAVTEVRSEADFQIGFTDAVAGRQYSKFDNDSSIVCVAGEGKDVYVGTGAGSSNLGMFIDPSMDCTLRNDNLPSGGRGVHKLICP